MYITIGTVDHFISLHEDRSLAYEWSNYRYCLQTINSYKGKTSAGQLLDPYKIQEGWFEIHLPSLQLRVSDTVPQQLQEWANFTLDKLRLRDHETVLGQRSEWYRMYQSGELTLEGLWKKAPLIAAAITKAGMS